MRQSNSHTNKTMRCKRKGVSLRAVKRVWPGACKRMFEGLRTVLQVPLAANGQYKILSKKQLSRPFAPATRRLAQSGQHPGLKLCTNINFKFIQNFRAML